MDTSETYIKMCDCPEIQEQHEYRHGGYFVAGGTDKTQPFMTSDMDGNWYIKPDRMRTIWLPRQDQLQEMSGLTWHDFDILSWACAWDDGKATQIPTKEVAGIMAVMQHRHAKVWTGTEWQPTKP